MVRRGRAGIARQLIAPVESSLAEESCGLCTEKFKDTPQWPVQRTPCGHAFHDTCLRQLILAQHGGAARCPICRRELPRAAASAPPVQQQQ